MFKNKKLYFLIITLLVIVLCCACSSKKINGNKSNSEEMNNIVYTPIEAIRSLNPFISKDEDTFFISKLIYDSLFEFDENLDLKKSLVEDYEYKEEGKTLKIKLKEGLRWSDGEILTAEDVVFSVQGYKLALKSVDKENIYKEAISNIKNIKFINTYNFQIEFLDLENTALSNLVFPILPKHKFDSVKDACNIENKFIPIGSNKYKVASYDIYSELVLEGNANYKGDFVKNEIHFVIIPDKNEISNLIGMDKMSLIFLDNMDREAYYSNKQVKFNDYISNEMEVIAYNFRSEKINDKNLRKAIAHAINNNYLKEKNYYNKAVLSDSIYYPNYLGISGEGNTYEFDLEKSGELLKKAGYIESEESGKLIDSDDEELIIRLLVNNNNPMRTNAANEIKESLEKLNLTVEVLPFDWDSYKEKIYTDEYDIFLGGYKLNAGYDLRFLLETSSNPIGYSNEKLDILLNNMEKGIYNDQRIDNYKKVKSIIQEELPYYCLFYKTYGVVYPENFDGLVDGVFFNRYLNASQWKYKYN